MKCITVKTYVNQKRCKFNFQMQNLTFKFKFRYNIIFIRCWNVLVCQIQFRNHIFEALYILLGRVTVSITIYVGITRRQAIGAQEFKNCCLLANDLKIVLLRRQLEHPPSYLHTATSDNIDGKSIKDLQRRKSHPSFHHSRVSIT